MPLVFGNLTSGQPAMLIDDRAAAEAVSARMRAAWIACATSGDPGWPPSDNGLVQIVDIEPAVAYPEAESRRIWQDHTFSPLALTWRTQRRQHRRQRPTLGRRRRRPPLRRPVPDSSNPSTQPRHGRQLRSGQRAELIVLDVGLEVELPLLTSVDRLIEAPSWHPDGEWIVVNADGLLFRLRAGGPTALEQIPATGLPPVNNDHILSPDGSWHVVSAEDGHLYRLPWDGGVAERITSDKPAERAFRHYLHGISPDGQTLAYVGTEMLGADAWGTRALWTLDLRTGHEERVGSGFSPADGPEFSPDGSYLYFNSEVASRAPGHAQLFRVALADGEVAQLTDDERVNWFPHVSPDGRLVSYLSYPAGTEGHPADLPVQLKMIDLSTDERRDLVTLPGGQGTINVNSWAPDSTRFAYIAYPIDENA